MLILKEFPYELWRPIYKKCFCLLFVNCNLEGNINSKCDFEKSNEEFKTTKEGGEFEKFSWMKVEFKKDELMIN